VLLACHAPRRQRLLGYRLFGVESALGPRGYLGRMVYRGDGTNICAKNDPVPNLKSMSTYCTDHGISTVAMQARSHYGQRYLDTCDIFETCSKGVGDRSHMSSKGLSHFSQPNDHLKKEMKNKALQLEISAISCPIDKDVTLLMA